MRIFVAGGTGVVGWRAVRLLVDAGHEVSVLSRSDEKALFIQHLGASPVHVSLFDAPALVDAVAGHDVVMNLATHIPRAVKAASAKAWAENDRIRIEGSRHLVDAALAAGANRYVQESLCFLYADGGDRWLDEDAPMVAPAPAVASAVVAAEVQAARMTDRGATGVVLRFGYFHAADSELTETAVKLTRFGRVPVLGAADAYYPIVHADDAAAAVVAALEAPAGIYNIVDDEPMRRGDYAAAMAAALGDAPSLKLPPKAMIRYVGKAQGMHLVASQRVSNRRFKEATGWAPAFTSARETLADVVKEWREPRRVRAGLGALALLVLAFGTLFVGAWAVISPHGFYDSFPGFGRLWVSIDGPFNEHLIRDVGALNLALTVLAMAAAVTMLVPMVRATAVAYLVYAVPHFAYHLTHLSHFETPDRIAMVGSLGSVVVVALGVLAISATAGRRPHSAVLRPSPRRVVPVAAPTIGSPGSVSARPV